MMLPFDSENFAKIVANIFNPNYWSNNLNHFVAAHLKKDYPYNPIFTVKNNLGEDYDVCLNNQLVPDLPFDKSDKTFLIKKGTPGKYGHKRRFFQLAALECIPGYKEYCKTLLSEKKVLEQDIKTRVTEVVRNYDAYLKLTPENARKVFIENGWTNIPEDFENFDLAGWDNITVDFRAKNFGRKTPA